MHSTEYYEELARALWSVNSNDLQPADFQAKFDAVYAAAVEPVTLWYLGGAANDFLRVHPGSIAVPHELLPQLLRSNIVDARIVGLKLLNRCSTNVDAVVSEICRALSSPDTDEVYGGLHELSCLISGLSPDLELPGKELLPILRTLFSSPDAYIQEAARRLSSQIDCI